MSTPIRWVAFVIGACVVVLLLVSFANYMVSEGDQRREEFKQDCTQQGGNPIELHRRLYCIVDGEKISY